ncbi:MAG: ABC transporter permease [Chloroflexi bacterium 13_1_40CM_4_65_16]|nr:MAG: ABC transporter permease [Chloroflexi bacterium 13_1_40CM_66_19]OLC49626.1 MAG: ABC transporter permease [Chloroflexi bacterium 13_1_40CM_4_65_16]OLD05095.1 MAG: ABC transporter permease [Actinobacteria bacterium 13_1_40CM_3_66_19]OLD54333.1 MAG: ABC transporter permease [Actinobacteria bacterium 13_1_40CM_2_66_13]OLE73033.1 MAG: ABC transporter permease [Actinobacteria bacterium 13_1_20CM_2_66_18]
MTPAREDSPEAGELAPTRRGRYNVLTRYDRRVLMLMVGIPLLLEIIFIWWPTLSSILLSFTNYDGVGDVGPQNFVGLKNYQFMFSGYTLFWPAFFHNVIWLAWLAFIATPIGIFFAVLLDRELRGTAFYQSVFFLPVVLSLVIVGFIWELQFSPTEGFINNAFGLTKANNIIDWLGNPRINLFAILIAASWRHVGYIMVIYLSGLKSVDPTLREAAKVDGANEFRTFFRVIFPVMAPINTVVAVITTIEALRAFDIAFIVNQGKNGLELLSILITNNSISEASLVGFGSAIAVILLVISLGPIIVFLSRVMRTTS